MATVLQKIDLFVLHLAAYKAKPGHFNPYQNDEPRHNLREYLRLMAKISPRPLLIVGEAPGYQGCRITGIPFSSSDIIQNPPHEFWDKLAPQLKFTTAVKENTASIVWNFLESKDVLPLFWNAFPFHPYQRYQPRSNRCPNSVEMVIGRSFLNQLATIFEVRGVIGLGRRGHQQAQQCFPELSIPYVRHPSFGGKPDFVLQMNEILK